MCSIVHSSCILQLISYMRAYTCLYAFNLRSHRSVSSWSEHGCIQELILAPSNDAAPSECSSTVKAGGLSLTKDSKRIG